MRTYLINQNTLNDFEDISSNVDADRVLIFIRKAQELDLRLFLGDAFYYDFIQYCSNVYGITNSTITVRTTTAAPNVYRNVVLTATSGVGINATADITVFNGSVTNIAIVEPGSGWNIGDTFTASGITGAVFTVSKLSVELVLADNMPQTYKDLFNGKSYTDINNHTIIYDGIVPALVYWTFARFIEADAVRYTSTGPVTKHHDDSDPVRQADIAKLVSQQRSVANAYANNIEKFLWQNKASFPLWQYNERNKLSRQPGPRIRSVDKTDYNRAGLGSYNNIDPFELGGFLNG